MKTFTAMGIFDHKLTMVCYEYVLAVQFQVVIH